MFASDVMPLNEHIIPKMLLCHLPLFCKMVLIHLVTNQLIDPCSKLMKSNSNNTLGNWENKSLFGWIVLWRIVVVIYFEMPDINQKSQ